MLLLASKFTQQIPDTAKKHYQSLKIKKTTQSVKQSEVINYFCSYIKLLKKLGHPKKGLIDIENIGDNKCFKWSTVRF